MQHSCMNVHPNTVLNILRLAFKHASHTTSAMTTRDRQMTQLKSQLAQLEANLVDMSNLMERTTEQALHIRELGILHASM
jgi:hypothetical protein